MQTRALISRSLLVSLCSFLFGTSLLLWFFFSDNALETALFSVAALLAVGAGNLYCLLQLLWRGRQQPAARKQLLRTAALMCLNIPLAMAYGKLVGVLLDTLVVRLVNDTNRPLSQLTVLGCGKPRPLPNLQPGQATLLWLPITPACFERTVSVRYRVGGATRQTIIEAYVVTGKRLNLKLGGSRQVAVAR